MDALRLELLHGGVNRRAILACGRRAKDRLIDRLRVGFVIDGFGSGLLKRRRRSVVRAALAPEQRFGAQKPSQ